MAKYCPYLSYRNKWATEVECLGKQCAWANKNGNCLIAKALQQYTDPLSALAQGYPVSNGQATFSDITKPYHPIKITFEGEKND